MIHLTPDRLDALLEGTLPAEEAAALREHLEAECPTCAEVIADGPDLVTLGRLLAGAWAGSAEHPAKEDLWRALSPSLPRRVARPWWRRWSWPVLGAALAAALALVVLRPPPQGPGGVKGQLDLPPAVVLRVAAGQPGPEGLAPSRRLGDGDVADAADTLLFDLEVDRPAARYLFVVDGEGVSWLLAPAPGTPARVEPAGRRAVKHQQGWVALDLGDMVGPLELVAAASEVVLEPRAEVVEPFVDGREVEGVGVHVVRIGIGGP